MPGYSRLGDAGEYLTIILGVNTIDASVVGNWEITGHRYYRYEPDVIQDLHEILTANRPPESRSNLRQIKYKSKTHWELVTQP